MNKLLMGQAALVALILAGCSQPPQDNAPSSEDQAVSAPETENTSESQDTPQEYSPELSEAASAAGTASEEEFLQHVPDNASFSQRRATGHVRVACTFDGQRDAFVLLATELPQDAKMTFDRMVSQQLRYGSEPGENRSLSGKHRDRSGALASIVTDPSTREFCTQAFDFYNARQAMPNALPEQPEEQ